MMKRYLLALFLAVAMLGCGDDDAKTLIKWDCNGGSCEYGHACAASASEALSASGCGYDSYGGSSATCQPMGDLCSCPDGASSCGIVSGN